MSDLHQKQFISAIKYIYKNIDEPIQLIDIAEELGISLSSLKRLFLNATGQSIGVFIRRVRMELAFRTLQNKEDTILEVALSAGFEDHAAFSRCFKQTFGYPPKQARKTLNIVNELDCIALDEPELLSLHDINLQSVTEQGLYFEAAPKAWQGLKKALATHSIDDDFSATFIGIGHDNPHDGDIKENQVRFTAAVAFLEDDLHINQTTLLGGTYAKFPYTGALNNLGLAYHYIYGKWMETSGFSISKARPAFIAFGTFPDSLTEQRVSIYVPLA